MFQFCEKHMRDLRGTCCSLLMKHELYAHQNCLKNRLQSRQFFNTYLVILDKINGPSDNTSLMFIQQTFWHKTDLMINHHSQSYYTVFSPEELSKRRSFKFAASFPQQKSISYNLGGPC